VHFKELPRTTGIKLLTNDRVCTPNRSVLKSRWLPWSSLYSSPFGLLALYAAAANQKPHELEHENTGATITAKNIPRPDQAQLPAACEMGAWVGASVGAASDEPFSASMSA